MDWYSVDAPQLIETLATAQRRPGDLCYGIQVFVEELFAHLVWHGGGLWTDDPVEVAAIPSPVNMSINITVAKHAMIVVRGPRAFKCIHFRAFSV